jgi:hypothetical protein
VARSISDEIEALAAKRHAAWAKGDMDTAKRIEGQLDALYDEKRQGNATHGTPKGRERAKKRAEVERELDRLMQS